MSLWSPFWDGHWDSAGLYQCIFLAVLEIRTADNAWTCDLLDRQVV